MRSGGTLFWLPLVVGVLLLLSARCSGEGTVFVHLHRFTVSQGCPDYSVTSARHTNACEVYLRVCLQPVFKQALTALCPTSSYTTERFPHVGGQNDISLSTAQPAKLSFTGAAQDYSVLVEAWGHEEIPNSRFNILSTFMVDVTESTGEWSENLLMEDTYPSTLSLQWQVKCFPGYLPVGTCSSRCQPTNCVRCLESGEKACRTGCDAEACMAQGMAADELRMWTPWSGWSECSTSCGTGHMTRSRTCPTHSVNEELNRPCVGDVNETQQCSGSDTCAQDCGGRPCQNGGQCRQLTIQQATVSTAQHQCICMKDFVGQYCDREIERSGLQADENLPVTIAIFLSVLLAMVMLVTALCCCYRRHRTARAQPAAGSKDGGEQTDESKGSTLDSFTSKDASLKSTDSGKSGRLQSAKRAISIVHPHFNPRQSWSRRNSASKLAVQNDTPSDVSASRTSLNSGTFQTPPTTLTGSSRLKVIAETTESTNVPATASKSAAFSTPDSSQPLPESRRAAPAFLANLTQHRRRPSATSSENIYQPPSVNKGVNIVSPMLAAGAPSPRLLPGQRASIQYDEIPECDVYEDVAKVTSSAAARSAIANDNQRRGFASRFGQCVGAGMVRTDGHAPAPRLPTQFGPEDAESGSLTFPKQSAMAVAVTKGRLSNSYEEPMDNISVSTAGSQRHHQHNHQQRRASPPTGSGPRSSVLTWWSKRSSGNSFQNFMSQSSQAESGTDDTDAGSVSMSVRSSERSAVNPLYNRSGN